jgi:hypothetical protein
MTVGRMGDHQGRLCRVLTEETGSSEGMKVQLSEQTGKIFADLTIGADVAGAEPLRASEELANRGMQLFGAGFIVTPDEARNLGLGRIEGLEKHIRPYRNGRDIAQSPCGALVIDLFGLRGNQRRPASPGQAIRLSAARRSPCHPIFPLPSTIYCGSPPLPPQRIVFFLYKSLFFC